MTVKIVVIFFRKRLMMRPQPSSRAISDPLAERYVILESRFFFPRSK